jgi:hypothetical protein
MNGCEDVPVWHILIVGGAMASKGELSLIDRAESLIVPLRRQKVLLDRDLAKVYGVSTSLLNRAVKRNAGRFPRSRAAILISVS